MGPAGLRQDNARANYCKEHAVGLHSLQRSAGRNQRNQGSDGQGGERAALRARTIVFVDEVHRFNRAQQDAFLPHVEAGNILLIGATTENPSFEVIAPLLSRMRVYVMQALSKDQIVELLRRALDGPGSRVG